VIIAADKALAITSPYKYRRWMRPRVVATIITSSWLLAVIPAVLSIATSENDVFIIVPEYGACVPAEDVYIKYVFIVAVPATVQSFLSISLNIYLSTTAIQVRKQIEKEMMLSGECEKLTALKKKQRNIRRNMKPIITLLVVNLANILGFLFFVVLFLFVSVLVDHQEFLQYVIIANSPYLVHLVNPITYGLYFRQVREPMMKCLKRLTRMNKVNAVAPQPRRTAWM